MTGERKTKAILDYVHAHPYSTAREIANGVAKGYMCSANQVSSILRPYVCEGTIDRVMNTTDRIYVYVAKKGCV